MSVYGGPDIITDGLVLHLDAANRKSYPGSGTSWNDLSGRGNHFTLQNTTYSSQNNGKFTFSDANSSGAKINTTTSEIQSLLCPMTIIAWAKQTSAGTYDIIFGQYSSTTNHQLVKMLRVDSRNVKYYYATPSGSFSSTQFTLSQPELNKWNFYSVVISGSVSSASIRISLNTTFQTVGSGRTMTTTPDTNVKTGVGSRWTLAEASGENWTGDISMVTVHNIALSDEQILNYYNATKGRFGL